MMASAMVESIGIPEWFNQPTSASGRNTALVKWTAESLYDEARSQAWRERIRSKLLGSPHYLLKLDTTARPACDAGLQTISIREIRGSENRSSDFDAQFHPLESRTRGRWVSIAAARLIGATLPPIELIQLGDTYYVRDGHHRLSVARALGEEYIEAHVLTWAKCVSA